MVNNEIWLEADWPAPNWLHAGTTLRSVAAGNSPPPYHRFNLAGHVGDGEAAVSHNRQLLITGLKLPNPPLWLEQIHSAKLINADKDHHSYQADGAYTLKRGMVVAVLTADCLPLLLCDRKRRQIAAIHVGWRGFSRGIVANTLSDFASNGSDCMAWIGPCIGPEHYEIDTRVKQACLLQGQHIQPAFTSTREGHDLADLKQMVALDLEYRGIKSIYISPSCTFSDEEKWFSYRRDGETGRMASLIWMD